MAGRQVEADQTAAAIFLIVLIKEAANLMGLHADNGILLRIEIDTTIVNLDSN